MKKVAAEKYRDIDFSRAKRGADANFLLPRQRSSKKQTGDVRAGNQQNESDCSQQDQQYRFDLPNDLFLQRNKPEASAGVRVVVFPLDAAGNDAQFCLGLLEVHTLLESSNEIGAMHEAPRQLCVCWLINPPEVRGPECKLETRGQHTDNGVTITVERE